MDASNPFWKLASAEPDLADRLAGLAFAARTRRELSRLSRSLDGSGDEEAVTAYRSLLKLAEGDGAVNLDDEYEYEIGLRSYAKDYLSWKPKPDASLEEHPVIVSAVNEITGLAVTSVRVCDDRYVAERYVVKATLEDSSVAYFLGGKSGLEECSLLRPDDLFPNVEGVK